MARTNGEIVPLCPRLKKTLTNKTFRMKKPLHISLLSLLSALFLFASCGEQFTVEGTSNITLLDGRMLYLEALNGAELKRIDSCEVVHGKFHFKGSLDSVRLANISMDDESVTPIILEGGKIQVKLDNTGQSISGTPLNDKLSDFLTHYNQLKNQQIELLHRHDRAIMDGLDMDQVVRELNEEGLRLEEEEDKFLLDFVTQNFDNVLGPSIFFMLTASYQYPMLTPWIEDVMSKATDQFKNDPYVKDYYSKAVENEQIMNGLKDAPIDATTQPATAPHTLPTPNQMAQP